MAALTIAYSPIETKELLTRFANYLYARRGLASSSVDLLVGFIRRLAPELGPDPSHAAIEQHVADLRRRGVSYAHVSNTIAALEHYMEFRGDPIRLKRPRKPQQPAIATLSEAKVAILIAATRTLRERAILALLAYSGLRNRELISLRIRNIDVAGQRITVECGKGSQSRVCYVAGACMEVLAAYLRERGGDPDELAFVTVRHGHQLQTQDIRKLVRTVARRAGLERRVWPHLFRHSLATALLDRGASIYSIQALLGHHWISTTLQYYLHPSSKTIQADYQRCAPSYV